MMMHKKFHFSAVFFRSMLVICFTLLAGCRNVNAIKPGETATLPVVSTTPTPTNTPTSTLTLTPTVEPTATSEAPAQPSVASGLREENAVGGPVFDTGTKTWVTKNKDGNVTATWNAETQRWLYSPENIKVDYTIGGFLGFKKEEVGQYLGPLPPDNPENHFIDPETGKPVPYGIGPETTFSMVGAVGNVTFPATQVRVRFRGIARLSSKSPNEKRYARIFEFVMSPDKSFIHLSFCQPGTIGTVGAPFNATVFDRAVFPSLVPSGSDKTGIDIANEEYIGKMVIIHIGHDIAPLITSTDKRLKSQQAEEDKRAQALLDYISGRSTQIPIIEKIVWGANILAKIIFPIK
jgi:hypothetical protein